MRKFVLLGVAVILLSAQTPFTAITRERAAIIFPRLMNELMLLKICTNGVAKIAYNSGLHKPDALIEKVRTTCDNVLIPKAKAVGLSQDEIDRILRGTATTAVTFLLNPM
jgi:hypothetical protein